MIIQVNQFWLAGRPMELALPRGLGKVIIFIQQADSTFFFSSPTCWAVMFKYENVAYSQMLVTAACGVYHGLHSHSC